MTIPFTKMQGLGNDFVVIDTTVTGFNLGPDVIRWMSDRRYGVGFDQLLVLESFAGEEADFTYRIFNADGSEAEQCGNGARCMAKFIQAQHPASQNQFRLATKNGVITTDVMPDGLVRVDMGVPQLDPAQIPFTAEVMQTVYHLSIDGIPVEVSAVGMGNPHAVYLVQDLAKASVTRLGKQIAEHKRFPQGTNVEFVKVNDIDDIELRVYERGVGETPACGSGACAAVVAGHLRGKLSSVVQVKQPGGRLQVEWHGPGEHLYMVGPADIVFFGQWPHASLT